MKSKPQEDDITFIAPDFTLKESIGENVNLRDVFSEDIITKAQQNIGLQQNAYFKWLAEDLDMLEHSYAALELSQDGGEKQRDNMSLVAISIKSQGGMFGYDLVSEIARSLYIFLQDFHFSKNECAVIRKHIDALKVIFDQRIEGMGGQPGHELLRDLVRLTAKFRKPI